MLPLTHACVAYSAGTPMSGLVDWLGSMPGSRLGPVRFAESQLGVGGGGYATRALKAGEVVLAVPLSAAVTVDDATADPAVGEALGRVCAEEGERAALAAYLARGQLATSRGRDSWFAAYSAVLPQREPTDPHMLWWTAAEVGLLRGSSAHAECALLRSHLALSLTQLCCDSHLTLALTTDPDPYPGPCLNPRLNPRLDPRPGPHQVRVGAARGTRGHASSEPGRARCGGQGARSAAPL